MLVNAWSYRQEKNDDIEPQTISLVNILLSGDKL